MSVARTFLLEALRRVAEGGDIQEAELDAAIPNPRALDRDEMDAWEQLSHWTDDGDIRERDDAYETFKRRWMRDSLAKLLASGS